MKQKKQYEQPETKIVELRVTNQLLTTSGGDYPQWEPENI